MQIICTHFIFCYDYILIQEQSYGHFSSDICLLKKVLPDDDEY